MKRQVFINMCKFNMFITAVCVLFLMKPRWPKNKSSHHSRFLLFSDMLWCAPEHIIDGEMDNRGSQKGDVYSYGIILQEIANRKPPYSMYPFAPQGNKAHH